MEYPEEWNDLPKRERKKKLKELKRQKEEQQATSGKIKSAVIFLVVLVILGVGYRLVTKRTPEEAAFEKEVEEVSLDGKVEEFEIEGREHIGVDEVISYGSNPPTSGAHWAEPADWGFYDTELTDEQLVHNIEHGGIWITYKDLDEDDINKLKNIARNNSDRVIVTKREKNDDPIAVASWGRYMKLQEIDEVLIQKYIDTHVNDSPEKLAH